MTSTESSDDSRFYPAEHLKSLAKCFLLPLSGRVAQWIARWTSDPTVAGPNPVTIATFSTLAIRASCFSCTKLCMSSFNSPHKSGLWALTVRATPLTCVVVCRALSMWPRVLCFTLRKTNEIQFSLCTPSTFLHSQGL